MEQVANVQIYYDDHIKFIHSINGKNKIKKNPKIYHKTELVAHVKAVFLNVHQYSFEMVKTSPSYVKLFALVHSDKLRLKSVYAHHCYSIVYRQHYHLTMGIKFPETESEIR